MASYIESYKSKLDWANTFVRTGNFPLDRSSMFDSYADAELYAKGVGNDKRGLGKTAYVGQIISVYENDEVNVYKINPDRSLESVGSGSGSLSIEKFTVVDGKVQEATTDNIGQIIYLTVGEGEYVAGPYIVSGEGTVSRLGTISGSGDIAGIASDVTTLKGQMATAQGDIATAKGDISGLKGEVNSLKAADTTLQNNIDSLGAVVVKEVKVNGVAVEKSEGSVNIDLSEYAKTSELPVYSIAKVETEEGYASSYKLTKNGVNTGATINIPKDKVLQSAVIKIVETDDQPVQGYKVGDKYFEFTFQNQTAKVYLLASELVDAYTGSAYINISETNEVSVNVNALAADIAGNTALTAKFDEKGAASTAAANALTEAKAYTNTEIGKLSYVAPEEGKGLSTNDFSDEYKSKVDGIEAGAQANRIESITVNGQAVAVESKTAKITYVESLDGLSSDEYRAVTAKAVAAKFNTVNDSLASKFTLEEVDTLPASGSRYTVYMEKIVDGEGNVTGYKEYLWMNNAWHAIGSSLYATKELASAENDGLMSKEHYSKLQGLAPMTAEDLDAILKA